MKVLIADGLEKEGIELFAGTGGVTADVHAALSADELKEKIAGYDGLIVRQRQQGDRRCCGISAPPQGDRQGGHRLR